MRGGAGRAQGKDSQIALGEVCQLGQGAHLLSGSAER